MMNRSQKRQRRARRGAAMVEAIVIAVTMFTFLGMNLFAVKAYGGKLDQATQVRRDIMYRATHNCGETTTSDPDTYEDPGLSGYATTSGEGGFVQDLKALFQSFATGGSLEAGVARGNRDGSVIGSAVIWPSTGISKRALTASMASKGAVVCNEKPYYGGLLSTMGSLIWDFMKGIWSLFDQ